MVSLIESDNSTHMFFVDAGNDIVRVGTSSGGDSANSVLQVGGGTDAFSSALRGTFSF